MELNDSNIDVFKNDIEYFKKLEEKINQIKEIIKPYQEQIKKLNEEKKEIEKQLIDTMTRNDLDKVEIPDGELEHKITKSVVPIKQNNIKDKIIKFFEEGPGSNKSFNSLGSKDKGFEIYNYIYGKENREKVIKESIKSKKK